MQAVAVTDVGCLEFVDVPMPDIRDYECLVRTVACGLCNGTDLKHIDGLVGEGPARFPEILGHEAVGEVVEVGSRVENFQIGDMITDPVPAVGDPAYRAGCAGFCEYGVVQDLKVMARMGLGREAERPVTHRAGVVRASISPVDAVMLVTLKETLSAVRNVGIGGGSRVLIYGDGPNGLALSTFARLEGASWVGVVGHWDERLERIRRTAGVDAAINSRRTAVGDVVGDVRPDVVIDAVGRVAVVREGFDVLARLGKLCVFGVMPNSEPDLPIRAIPNGASLQMLPWPVGANDVHDEVIDMVVDGRLKPSAFYSEVQSWRTIADAVARVRSRDAFKIILTID